VGQLHSDWSQTASEQSGEGRSERPALFLGGRFHQTIAVSSACKTAIPIGRMPLPTAIAVPLPIIMLNPAYKACSATGAYVVGVQDNGGKQLGSFFHRRTSVFAAGKSLYQYRWNSFFVIYSDTMSCRSLSTGAATWKGGYRTLR